MPTARKDRTGRRADPADTEDMAAEMKMRQQAYSRLQKTEQTEHRREMQSKDSDGGNLLRPGERIDDLQRNGLKIIQDPKRFCFGMDAVLLSGFAAAGKGDQVLDLGTGTGIIPLLMSAKTEAAHFTGLELQKDSADMAARSVRMNGLQDRIEIREGSIRDAAEIWKAASFQVVTSNPPYMISAHGMANPKTPLAIARHEIFCTFDDVAAAAETLLIPGGHFYLVHRPFRLPEIMTTLQRHHLEPKRMKMCYPYIDHEPNMVLLDCVRGARPRLTVEKPLIVYSAPGKYTQEIYDVYGY